MDDHHSSDHHETESATSAEQEHEQNPASSPTQQGHAGLGDYDPLAETKRRRRRSRVDGAIKQMLFGDAKVSDEVAAESIIRVREADERVMHGESCARSGRNES